jgi:DNA polymerase-3 subunit gamma/tau
VGQEHITRTLKNALAGNRVGHAYLFCGPRGTGKTTTAKVLAKALNCSSRQQGAEPCNACSSCREIAAGSSLDVIEIDAASHRGIDEIRDLREKIGFLPTAGAYRVYIIDEVHMLTQEAFNALLKTLEEPPGHVVFILATTEPHKLPLTILSRCQRFDFHRIGLRPLLDRLREVCRGAGLEVEEEALYHIARAADGGLRDALSILDQVAAFGEKRVTAKDVHDLLGTVREDVLDAAVAALCARDAAAALKIVRSLVEQGRDLRLFVRELLGRLRALLLLLVSRDLGEELSPREKEKFAGEAEALGEKRLQFLLGIFNRAEQEMRWSFSPRITLEVALVQAVRGEEALAGGDLALRVARLEELVSGWAGKPGVAGGQPGSRPLQPLSGTSGPPENRPEKVEQAPAGKEPEKKALLAMPGSGEGRPGENDRRKTGRWKGGESAGERGALSRPGRQERPASAAKSAGPAKKEEPAPVPGSGQVAAKEEPAKSGGPALEDIVSRWGEFLAVHQKKDPPLYTFLSYGWPQQLIDGTLVVAFEKGQELCKEYVEGKRGELSPALKSFFHQEWQVRLAYGERPEGIDFSPRDKELSTEEALSLFGVQEEEGEKPADRKT